MFLSRLNVSYHKVVIIVIFFFLLLEEPAKSKKKVCLFFFNNIFLVEIKIWTEVRTRHTEEPRRPETVNWRHREIILIIEKRRKPTQGGVIPVSHHHCIGTFSGRQFDLNIYSINHSRGATLLNKTKQFRLSYKVCSESAL